jgi:ribosomal protein S27E
MSQSAIKERSPHSPPYKRHRTERTLLYQIIEQYYPSFRDVMAMHGKSLPLRVQCTHCHHEHLVAFSCKRRGFCPNCGTRRMAESAALLVDEVLPEQPIRQWVLSFPFQLRFLFAHRAELMDRVLGIVYRAISAHLINKAGFTRKTAQTGAVTLIQRFGSALNLNVHFHGVFAPNSKHRVEVTPAKRGKGWPHKENEDAPLNSAARA